MSLTIQYVMMARKLISAMDINISDYKDEFISTYKRMASRHSIIVKDVLCKELLDSIVDIMYYLSDYIATARINNQELDNVFKSSEFDPYIDIVQEFSDKACTDYFHFTGKVRTLDRKHIDKMVCSEIFEYLSLILMRYYNISINRLDIGFQLIRIIFLSQNIYNDDYPIILIPELSDDSSDLIHSAVKILFTNVHSQNMLKIYPEDDRFHFDNMKVTKPSNWDKLVSDSGLDDITTEIFIADNLMDKLIETVY